MAQLRQENAGVNLHDLRLGNSFLDITPKAQAAKDKLERLNFVNV